MSEEPEGIPENIRASIRNALKAAGANKPCPRCDHDKLGLVGRYTKVLIQNEMNGLNISGGKNIPSFTVVCENCGYLSIHAIGILKNHDTTLAELWDSADNEETEGDSDD